MQSIVSTITERVDSLPHPQPLGRVDRNGREARVLLFDVTGTRALPVESPEVVRDQHRARGSGGRVLDQLCDRVELRDICGECQRLAERDVELLCLRVLDRIRPVVRRCLAELIQ